MNGVDAAALVAELDRMLVGTDITELTLETAVGTLTLRREAEGATMHEAGADPAEVDTAVVAAPCPGVFLARHPLRETPFAVPGQTVAAGAVLGLLRAGTLLVEVAAPCAGTVTATEAAEGLPVGYGAPLFRLRRDEGKPG